MLERTVMYKHDWVHSLLYFHHEHGWEPELDRRFENKKDLEISLESKGHFAKLARDEGIENFYDKLRKESVDFELHSFSYLHSDMFTFISAKVLLEKATKRVQVVKLPVGSGKTFFAFLLAYICREQNYAVVVPDERHL